MVSRASNECHLFKYLSDVRVHIQDVLAKIAQVSGGYSGMDMSAAVEEYWSAFPYKIRMSITADIEYTEAAYLEKYSKGVTAYFALVDYRHGKQLASELYHVIFRVWPDMKVYDGSAFNPKDRLYLFVHVSDGRSS